MQIHKYDRKSGEIQVIAAVYPSGKLEVGEVANRRWDKTAVHQATNECERVTPTSEWSSHVHYSKKHQFVVNSIEKFRVL